MKGCRHWEGPVWVGPGSYREGVVARSNRPRVLWSVQPPIFTPPPPFVLLFCALDCVDTLRIRAQACSACRASGHQVPCGRRPVEEGKCGGVGGGMGWGLGWGRGWGCNPRIPPQPRATLTRYRLAVIPLPHGEVCWSCKKGRRASRQPHIYPPHLSSSSTGRAYGVGIPRQNIARSGGCQGAGSPLLRRRRTRPQNPDPLRRTSGSKRRAGRVPCGCNQQFSGGGAVVGLGGKERR